MRKILLTAISLLVLVSCGQNPQNGRAEEITLIRALEKAIETGDLIIRERELLENVALTEGTPAAVKLECELNHRHHYNEFKAQLEHTNELCNQIDSSRLEAVIEQIIPYIVRLEAIVSELPGSSLIRDGGYGHARR